MGVTFPNESAEYRRARNALLEQEIELRRQMESLAEQRRKLPAGGKVPEDYEFDTIGSDGQPTKIKLSQLFREGTDTLILYNYMFPRYKTDSRDVAKRGNTARLAKEDQPCPSCTALIDQLNAAAPHFEAGGGNFAVVAKAPLDHLIGVACDRAWRDTRVLSSANNPKFRRDYHGEDEEGQQQPLMLVFKREADATIRLFWASELMFAPSDPGQDPRANGTVEPLWNLFDLTPGGRPDFNEQLQYDCCHGARARTLKEVS